jgi:hypothetical protein
MILRIRPSRIGGCGAWLRSRESHSNRLNSDCDDSKFIRERGRAAFERFAFRWSRLGLRLAGVDCGFQSDRPDLGFLGLRHLAAKIQVNSYWISLDFLGFSRPKPAVSMGYAGFSLKEISRALSPARQDLGTAAHDFGPRKGTDWSWGKGNSLSAFLQ